jgi:hypothetical protein
VVCGRVRWYRPLPQAAVLYNCLDSIWSHDMKCKKYLALTICTTITQFKTEASSVITTCLGDQSMKASDWAQVVEHWIEVARLCCKRELGIPDLRSFSLRMWTVVRATAKTPGPFFSRLWPRLL